MQVEATTEKSELAMSTESQTYWVTFFAKFSEGNGPFIRRLSRGYPALSKSEFRLSCYLRAGYSSREIAENTGKSLRTVENRRYRLRKKLPIQSHENLTVFLMKI